MSVCKSVLGIHKAISWMNNCVSGWQAFTPAPTLTYCAAEAVIAALADLRHMCSTVFIRKHIAVWKWRCVLPSPPPAGCSLHTACPPLNSSPHPLCSKSRGGREQWVEAFWWGGSERCPGEPREKQGQMGELSQVAGYIESVRGAKRRQGCVWCSVVSCRLISQHSPK